MKLLLKVLELKNFKGIKQLKLLFDDTEVRVHGANGTGKTTLVDAFMWLLFDKDSQDRKDFEIKTLDSNNQPIHFLDHEVSGVFDANGRTITLSKRLNEKWVKKRGQSQQEFSGHETTYYIDGVPCKKTEYQSCVAEIINEKTFKLLTNPIAFEAMKWQDKRNILFEVCGNIEDKDVPGYEKLEEILKGKDIGTFKKSIAASKKKLKQDIENIPPRIDELKLSIGEAINKDEVYARIAEKHERLDAFNEQLEASQKQFEVVRVKQQELLSLERTKDELIRKHNQEAYGSHNQLKQELEYLKSHYNNNQSEQDKLVKLIENKKQDSVLLNGQVNGFRKEWQQIAEETFDEHKAICPACGQHLPEDKLQELVNKYQSEKLVRLDRIVNAANAKKTLIEQNDKAVSEYGINFEKLATENVQISNGIKETEEKLALPIESTPCDTSELDEKIYIIKSQIQAFSAMDNTEIKEQIKQVNEDISADKLIIAQVDAQEKTVLRIKDLENQHKELQVKLADVEQEEILVEDFTRAKIDVLETNINSKFSTVKFKLFEQQINGGLAECCESLIDGVPFSNANNAARIAAGIDIINVLSKHYGLYAPIWLDNRESVTDIPITYSQVINLVVSENDKELRVK